MKHNLIGSLGNPFTLSFSTLLFKVFSKVLERTFICQPTIHMSK